jgi:hypothetical protein
MPEAIWIGLAAKLLATAGVVVLACLVVERSGPLFGAMIATLPVSAGPAYAFLAMEHDADFVAVSALGSLATIAATAVCVTVYALLAPRRGLAATLGGALLAWGAAVAAVRPMAVNLAACLMINAAVFAICLALSARARAIVPVVRSAGRRWDIPVRALAAMALVGAVLVIGRALGPRAAGTAAVAPVVLTSLGLLLYPRLGGAGAAAVMANTLPGLIGNAVALAALNRTAVPLGAPAAMLLALAICIGWNAGLLAVARLPRSLRLAGPQRRL